MDFLDDTSRARLEDLENLIRRLLAITAGASPTFAGPWTPIASGVTNQQAGQNKFAANTTAGGATINLLAMTGNQLLIVSMSAGANPILIKPAGATTIADPNNNNVQGATATISNQGGTAAWQFDAPNNRLLRLW